MQDVAFVQCGREITAEELDKIRTAVADLRRLSRREIAEAVCEELQWFAATGSYKMEACTKLLLKLEAHGVLKLPERRTSGGRPHCRRPGAALPEESLGQETEVAGNIGDIGPVHIEVVEGDRAVEDWNALVSRHHYLGYRQPIGCFLRYLISSPSGILGCALFAGAARALSVRDAWIGWSPRQRLCNLGWVVNNTRLLILPWVRVSCLASHVLGQLERRVARDWESRWGYRPVLMESFVDPVAFRGTCYKAANWQYLGNTTGEGLARRGRSYQTTSKMLFVRPLTADFRAQLCSHQLTGRVL
jgi:hypothetical protein